MKEQSKKTGAKKAVTPKTPKSATDSGAKTSAPAKAQQEEARARRDHVQQLKRLFASGDQGQVQMGLELLRGLGDPAIADELLKEARYDPITGRLEHSSWLKPGRTLFALLGVPGRFAASIKTLDLSLCQLDALPTEICKLTNLTKLNLSGNHLTSLPAEIGNLTNLTDLSLGANDLTSVPAEIAHLTNLTRLDLHSNQLSDLPREIGNLKNLTKLNLNSNRLTSLPGEIGNLTNLTELSLERSGLSSLPVEVENLRKLVSLSIDDQVKKPENVVLKEEEEEEEEEEGNPAPAPTIVFDKETTIRINLYGWGWNVTCGKYPGTAKQIRAAVEENEEEFIDEVMADEGLNEYDSHTSFFGARLDTLTLEITDDKENLLGEFSASEANSVVKENAVSGPTGAGVYMLHVAEEKGDFGYAELTLAAGEAFDIKQLKLICGDYDGIANFEDGEVMFGAGILENLEYKGQVLAYDPDGPQTHPKREQIFFLEYTAKKQHRIIYGFDY